MMYRGSSISLITCRIVDMGWIWLGTSGMVVISSGELCLYYRYDYDRKPSANV